MQRREVGMENPTELRGRINLALSLLNHRPHHPSDDDLIRLIVAALEGVPFEVLLREAN